MSSFRHLGVPALFVFATALFPVARAVAAETADRQESESSGDRDEL